MKRVDLEPTYNEVLELIKKDALKRNSELAEMIKTLQNIEAPYCIFLDADWGAGKTVFVKELIALTEAIGDNDSDTETAIDIIQSDEHLKEILSSRAENPTNAKSIIPLYYNAWENDFWHDPLPSLLQTIAWGGNLDGSIRDGSNDEALICLLNEVLEAFHLDAFSEPLRKMRGDDLLNDFRNRLAIRKKVRDLLQHVSRNEEATVLLAIDELDRCKPTFALQLLEEVKNLFTVNNLIVLYAVNTEQLSKTISGFYGAGLDAQKYLERFYDVKYILRVPRDERYLRSLGYYTAGSRITHIVQEMISSLGMSLREQNRYYSELTKIDNIKHDANGVCPTWFVESCLSPALLAVKAARPDDYLRIVGKMDDELLSSYLLESDEMKRCIDALYSSEQHSVHLSDIPNAGITAIRNEILRDMLILVYEENLSSPSYCEAYERRLAHSFDTCDLHYIGQAFLR